MNENFLYFICGVGAFMSSLSIIVGLLIQPRVRDKLKDSDHKSLLEIRLLAEAICFLLFLTLALLRTLQ